MRWIDLFFSSREELYKRIRPALSTKREELRRVGFPYIREIDIWNYLVENKWREKTSLMLSDVVSDILHMDCNILDQYVKEKLEKETRVDRFQELELI